jgi:hypothetical protein
MNKSNKADEAKTHEWENEAARLQRRAHDLIRERPLMALTLAVAGGYLAGRVLSRV